VLVCASPGMGRWSLDSAPISLEDGYGCEHIISHGFVHIFSCRYSMWVIITSLQFQYCIKTLFLYCTGCPKSLEPMGMGKKYGYQSNWNVFTYRGRPTRGLSTTDPVSLNVFTSFPTVLCYWILFRMSGIKLIRHFPLESIPDDH
jgi:hypothetical protein